MADHHSVSIYDYNVTQYDESIYKHQATKIENKMVKKYFLRIVSIYDYVFSQHDDSIDKLQETGIGRTSRVLDWGIGPGRRSCTSSMFFYSVFLSGVSSNCNFIGTKRQ